MDALPENIRQEVISEHLRQQRLQQQRAAAARSAESGETANGALAEINPEILAALPPYIQEEVLAQQRAEQQRLAAQNSSPDMPVDAADFIQALPPALRRQVLADLDDSQLALLPPEIAQEARNLRREMEARQRQLQERFFNPQFDAAEPNAQLAQIMRNFYQRPRHQLHMLSMPPYAMRSVAHAASSYSFRIPLPAVSGNSRSGSGGVSRDLSGAFSALTGGQHAARNPGFPIGRLRGKQLLDNEALSCLLILLFVDEPKLNIARLHRVLRHLCNHLPTRHWVIQSLLTIMERARESRDQQVADVKQRKSSNTSHK